jgi:hypothetical protein
MNRPGPGVRAMGSPSGAFAMFTACGLVVAGVFMGVLPWWLALFAFGFANGTVSAVRQMRVYNAWAEQWQEMATGRPASAPPRARPREKRNWAALNIPVGVALAIGLPWLASQVDAREEKEYLAVLWLVDCGTLLFLVVRAIVRRPKAQSAATAKVEVAQQVEPTVPVVAWLIGKAVESPSRAEAMRELPEYSARMLEPSLERASVPQR